MASAQNPFDSDEKNTKEEPPNNLTTENERPNASGPPEPEEGLLVKPFCECSTCNQWTNSADWCPTKILEFEGSPEKCLRREKKPNPLLQSGQAPVQNPKIIAYNPKRLTNVERQKVFRTLVHGITIPEPVTKFTETYFSKEIQVSLEALNYIYSTPIQSFVWPAIFRQMNVIMIGNHKAGKTIAYLPAICTVHKLLEEKYNRLAKYKSPIVVIIGSNSKQCEEILDLIKKIYDTSKTKARPKVSIVTYPVSNVPYTDILITLPDSLIYCLKERIFNMKRLCHIVLEDASTLLKHHEDSIYKILDVTNEMLEHRPFNAQVQLIATSEKWSIDFKKLMKKLYVTPLTCISNYLEAALYGNVKFEFQFLMSSKKMEYLEGVLKDKYHLYRTVVICDQSEITHVNKWLVRTGIKTIALSNTSSKEEIEEYQMEWFYTPGGLNKVLLCTDFVFDSLLNINDAMWLINFSFPETWTRFTKRFSALSSYYKSPLESKEEGVQCKSFILIDENSKAQMAKILHLMNRLYKDLPTNCQKYAEGFREENERDKLATGVSLCERLKLFGKCPDSLCESRHLVSAPEDVSVELPQCGKVVFKILNMKDVTTYTVHLIEHIDLNNCVHKISSVDLKKPLVYSEDEKKKRAENVSVNTFYAHCDYTSEGEEYTLCHVTKMERETVDVMLINGLPLQTLKKKLFEVPSNLSIVDVIFCNLIPPFKDPSFSSRAFYVAKTSLEGAKYKSMILTGTLCLQLDKTLWLDNVGQMFNVDGTNVVKFNLTKHIFKLNVVESCKNQMSNLHKLCKRCAITLPTYVKRIVRKPVKKKEVEPQTAFLDDNVQEVILSSAVSPDELYVRLTKFQSLLDNLEKDIQNVVQTEILHKTLKIEIGKYYLAPDPRGQTYSRVKLLNVENNKALCFYVDYGDEAIVEVNKLKILPSKFLTKLPFQAIQCRLYGLGPAFGEWDDESTDVLYKYLFEPDSDIFRSLYAVSPSKDEGDMIRAKVKYSVLLKDGYGEKNVLINQLLYDCGLATSIFDKIDDFEIPSPQVVEGSDDSLDSDFEKHQDFEAEEPQSGDDILQFSEDAFDFQIFDEDKFLEMLGLPNLRKVQQRQQMSRAIEADCEKNKTEDSPEKICVDASGCLTPEVFWSQTDNTVRLKIKIIGVEQYKVNVIQKRIFTFSTNLDDKKYELKFTLHKPAELTKHFAAGQEVKVFLNKIETTEWLQLTGTSKRFRYIHYELRDTEEVKPKRKFLQLDITDSESSGDEDDKPMYYVCSDMDSDLDEDAFSSSESD